jgi:hypothetical protein
MVVKIVHDHLVETLSGGEAPGEVGLELRANPPVVVMMVGLQGSGKTTTAGKIALRLRTRERKKVLLASLDVARPAAQEQLAVLGRQAQVASLPVVPGEKPVADGDAVHRHRPGLDLLLQLLDHRRRGRRADVGEDQSLLEQLPGLVVDPVEERSRDLLGQRLPAFRKTLPQPLENPSPSLRSFLLRRCDGRWTPRTEVNNLLPASSHPGKLPELHRLS